MTSICQEQNDSKYFHSQALHDFTETGDSNQKQAFFKFTLKREVNAETHAFAISVI